MSRYVSRETCEEIKRLSENGLATSNIAAKFGYCCTTINRHRFDRCRHIRENKLSSREKIVAGMRELAADIGRLPAKKDWREWDEQPCSVSRVEDHYSQWSTVWEDAGLPVVPVRAPEAIRTVAFQSPELTRQEVEQ